MKGFAWNFGLSDALQIDSMTLAYAIHRLSGIATPANAAYSASELEFQLKSSGATLLFTVNSARLCGTLQQANVWQIVHTPPRNFIASC